MSITLEDVKKNGAVSDMINAANEALKAIGYTEHGMRHVCFVSHTAGAILTELNFDERTVELAKIAGYLHDVGNLVNRNLHGIAGAALVVQLLQDMGMEMQEIARIACAIGNHEEQVGKPASEITAALIIADKIDAHRSRVRKGRYNRDDIHDRVNYAIKKNVLEINAKTHTIRYEFFMDDTSSAMDFFEIYMSRMKLSEEAAAFLGCSFELYMNGIRLNTRKM